MGAWGRGFMGLNVIPTSKQYCIALHSKKWEQKKESFECQVCPVFHASFYNSNPPHITRSAPSLSKPPSIAAFAKQTPSKVGEALRTSSAQQQTSSPCYHTHAFPPSLPLQSMPPPPASSSLVLVQEGYTDINDALATLLTSHGSSSSSNSSHSSKEERAAVWAGLR